jgi:cytochrome c553
VNIQPQPTIFWVFFCLSFAGSAASQELTVGEALYQQHNCQVCHGESGRGGIRGGYPKISGQDTRYVIQQITDIRDGVRDNGQTRLMRPLVMQLDDLEIEEIARYLNSRP